jgi:4-hydroxythreonine-4-phosphate dehydrogenase
MSAAVRDALLTAPEASFVVLGAENPGLPLDPRITFQSVGSFDGSERAAGEISLRALRHGTALCLGGEAEGLVTGPVSKPALHAAGDHHPGQTELLGELTGAEEVAMLMATERTRLGPPLRILLLTTHLPLREVSVALTGALLESRLRLLHSALQKGWDLPDPRIALCALNPHASDGGLFGDEEARVLEPAVSRLRDQGMQVEGPFPADTVFHRVLSGAFDAVAVPAHDVGMAVFKTLSFGAGVNITLGLPFPRTSPDHGTAFDRVGTGTADSASAREAILLALRLAQKGAL